MRLLHLHFMHVIILSKINIYMQTPCLCLFVIACGFVRLCVHVCVAMCICVFVCAYDIMNMVCFQNLIIRSCIPSY